MSNFFCKTEQYFIIFPFFVILLLYWGYIVTFTKFLTVYHSWICPLHHLLYPPFFHSWNSFNISLSIFLNKYIVIHHIHPLILFPYILCHSTGTRLQIGPDLPSCFPFLKKGILFKKLYKKFHCDISMYICIIIWIVSSPLFFSFYLSPLLMLFSKGLKILYSFLYRKYIIHIYLLSFLLLLPSPLSVICFWKHCLLLYCIYLPHVRENMWPLFFWAGLHHLTWCPPIHPFTFKPHGFIIPYGWIQSIMCISHFLNPLINHKASRLLL
jgi:hypothetical protein